MAFVSWFILWIIFASVGLILPLWCRSLRPQPKATPQRISWVQACKSLGLQTYSVGSHSQMIGAKEQGPKHACGCAPATDRRFDGVCANLRLQEEGMTKQELIDAELETYAKALHDFLWFIDGIKVAVADWMIRHPPGRTTVAREARAAGVSVRTQQRIIRVMAAPQISQDG